MNNDTQMRNADCGMRNDAPPHGNEIPKEQPFANPQSQTNETPVHSPESGNPHSAIRNPHSSRPDWLRALYPFAQNTFVTPRGARMNYADEGPRTDEAVLMLHGNPTWSFFYRDIIRALSPSLRCIAPDHIGMGLSEKPSARDYPYTLAQRIADIETLVASLNLRRIHLIVHDWGGAIGFGFATRHPEKIGRITILNTAAFPDIHMPARIGLCRAPLGIGALIVRGFNGFAWPATWMTMHRRKLTPDEKRAYLFPHNNWANRVAVHEFVRDIPMSPAHPTHATLTAIERNLPLLVANPKLIVWGGADFCFNDHFYNRWRKVYPEAATHHFPDVGHYLLDDGGEEVRAKIVQFFTQS
ncbi:alpha/beta fold hydrolase [Ereboglobus luteus]|nr:alpha/beta fold hydrolase [Ereboglobus luteus]